MRKILFLIVLATVALAVIGFRRGWLHLASDGDGATTNVTLTVDKNQMQQDGAKALGKVQEATEHAKQKVTAGVEKGPTTSAN